MKNLFNKENVVEIQERLSKLSSKSERRWGKMNTVQMLAHCNVSMETAMGQNTVKRTFIGKMIGSFFKPMVLGKKPFAKNSPTDKSYIFTGRTDLDFDQEKEKLSQSVQAFMEGGRENVTTDEHPFFGKFTPDEWAILQWKHLDHHLRQFGV